PFNDATVEGPEDVIVTLNASANYDVGMPGTATITIADNVTPVVTVTAIDPDASEVGPDTGTFRFTRVGDLTFPLQVTFTVSGTATNGADYTIGSTVVGFLAGQPTADRVVTPFNDATVEGPEN